MNYPDLEPDDPPVVVITRRARRRLLGAAVTLLGLLALPYVVPTLADVRPWHPDGSYVPFWNVTSRPTSDGQEQSEREQLAMFEELAIGADEGAPPRKHPAPRPRPPPRRRQRMRPARSPHRPYSLHILDTPTISTRSRSGSKHRRRSHISSGS